MGLFDFLKGRGETLPEEEYIEIDLKHDLGKKAKIVVRPFVLRSFDDVNKILDALREGFTIALVDIKYLRSKDLVELKRVISKLKKTCDALGGEVAGFGENIIIVTPNFVRIYKGERLENVEALEKKRTTYKEEREARM